VVAAGAVSAVGNVTWRMLQQLGADVADAKTTQRAPGQLAQIIDGATAEGGGVLYQDIEPWVRYWQQAGVEPSVAAAEITGDPQAFARSMATGEPLQIPTSRYAIKVAATDHHAFFADELRLGPDQMNQREAREFETRLAAQPVDEAPEAGDPYAEAVFQQLVAAGMRPEDARQNADLYGAGVGSLLTRSGFTPEFGLNVTREGDATAPGAAGPNLDKNAQPGQTAGTDATDRQGEGAGARAEGDAAGARDPEGAGGGPAGGIAPYGNAERAGLYTDALTHACTRSGAGRNGVPRGVRLSAGSPGRAPGRV
jgi:hypothetical protein